jgi:uncharacterized repeat protein (TIGR02543 family)
MTNVTFTVTQVVSAAPTYTIASITNQTMSALTSGYSTSDAETKTITVTNTGTGSLNSIATSITGTDFDITQPTSTSLASSASTPFTIKAKDGLAVGTYTATVTISATNMTNVSFTVTQVVSNTFTYTIEPISNQSMSVVTSVYGTNTGESKTITIKNTGTGVLENISTSISGGTSSKFNLTQPILTALNSGAQTSFLIKAKDNLAVGIYTETVTIFATNMSNVAFTVTERVDTVPTYTINFIAADSQDVTRSVYSGATLTDIPTVPTKIGYTGVWDTSDFTNITTNKEVHAIYTLNSYTITYDSQGGSAVSSVTADYASKLIKPTDPTRNGYVFSGWFKESNTISQWIFSTETVPAQAITLYAKWIVPSSESPSEGSSTTTTTTPPTTKDTDSSFQAIVNGEKQEDIGKSTEIVIGGEKQSKIVVENTKLDKILEGIPATQASSSTVITVPVTADTQKVSVELNGQMVKDMEAKNVILEVKSKKASYKIPADEINISAISQALGKQITLSDIKINVELQSLTGKAAKEAENTVVEDGYTLVAPPIAFNIICSYEGKQVDVSQFNTYVSRTIAIPDGVNPNKITTAIVIEPDQTSRHVPTKIIVNSGKYYAEINSLTNSIYSVIWNPYEFNDVTNHWAAKAINDMGSRLIISGVGNGNFDPDRAISRAEFAAIAVRALGLKVGEGENHFNDVEKGSWYEGYIQTATKYKILSGYTDGSFKPNANISREEAMSILSRAMDITKLKANEKITENVLATYADNTQISQWATDSVAKCVNAKLVSGRDNNHLAPQDNITRAEVAVIIRNLLQKSALI